ncbi:MAG: YlxM family DNA-binding protein [Anaerotignum sp.]
MMEILMLTLLYDFYGELLTEKQKQVFELHYQNDLSLSEIGEELAISRQAVRDQLKRTEKILIGYEEKLRLVERFQQQQKAVREIKSVLDQIGMGEINKETTQAITTMKQIADAILS